ncbi:MAG: GNAT family N-acetyltransferase [Halobacterium sp.]
MPGAMFAAGDSVTLRTIEEDDLEFLAAGRNDPEIRRPLTVNRPSNVEQNRGFFEDAISSEEDVNLLICRTDGEDSASDADAEDADGGESTNDDGADSESADGDAEVGDGATPVGMLSLFDEDDIAGTATLAYWVLPEHQGNGFCTEATGLLCEYAFAERRLNKLRADALATNDGSQRVLEKLGFVEEGVLREEKFVYGEYVDVYRYGLLADDWEGV